MELRDCVFKPLLPYLLVLSRRDGFSFARRLIELFPFYRIDGPANTLIAEGLLAVMKVGDDAKAPAVSEEAFDRFVRDAGYADLDLALNSRPFNDFLYDADVRHRADALSMTHVFDKRAIIELLRSQVNEEILECYLKYFSDFSQVSERSVWIDRYVFDSVFHSLFQLVVKYNSPKHILTALELSYSGPERSPMAEMDKILTIVEAQVVEALRSDNKKDLQSWLKFKLAAVEKYHAMLGGDADVNTQKLLDALEGAAEYRDPKVYTVEELNGAGGGVKCCQAII
jgi:hypothetical protein